METQAQWLEISMHVDGESAEAVAEVLTRFMPAGVVIEGSPPSGDWKHDLGSPDQIRVAGYLPVDDQMEATRRQLEEALWYLGKIRALPPPQFRTIQEMDWSEAWKKNFQPLPIGRKLLIAPSWVEADPQGRIVIRIDPGMAFGTGTHPTTQLSLEFLETEIQPEQPVIDIGCGSGILAIAALKLGASQALGVDLDPEAVKTAKTNAGINGVSQSLEILQGSVAEVLVRKQGFRQAPLILANILAPVLIELLGSGLAELVTGDGGLILSGILLDQERLVLAAGRAAGLRLAGRKQEGDWVAFLFHKH